MVGEQIVHRLISQGYSVRVLSRSSARSDDHIEYVCGGLDDKNALQRLVSGASAVFHCAAELRQAPLMWDVNVGGTERLVTLLRAQPVRTFCFISSAGVVGLTHAKWVTEDTPCNPQTEYEGSKWAAERIVAEAGIPGCQVVILRPTDVVDDRRPGALALPMSGTWRDFLRVVLKGAECAHIVHAADVADAALFFVDRGLPGVQRYFVSCDDDPQNTFAGLWSLYMGMKRNTAMGSLRPAMHMPIIVPHLVRRALRGPANSGDVKYSPAKLLSEGFRYRVGVTGAVRRLIDRQAHGQPSSPPRKHVA
jgi:nucleoside-diphosphate-sugar epimerase